MVGRIEARPTTRKALGISAAALLLGLLWLALGEWHWADPKAEAAGANSESNVPANAGYPTLPPSVPWLILPATREAVPEAGPANGHQDSLAALALGSGLASALTVLALVLARRRLSFAPTVSRNRARPLYQAIQSPPLP